MRQDPAQLGSNLLDASDLPSHAQQALRAEAALDRLAPVTLRLFDWLLLLAAVGAVVGGLVLQGPVCIPVFGSRTITGCVEYRFPTVFLIGTVIALAAVATIFIRLRRRKHR